MRSTAAATVRRFVRATARGVLLIHRITGAVEPQMPKDKDPLTPAQIALVRRWIDQGARATSASPPAPQPWEAPLALAAPRSAGDLWAGWTAPLDRLVASYLAAHKTAAHRAGIRPFFARRVYLDVWGLLPTPEELQRFVDDTGRISARALVATLLADDREVRGALDVVLERPAAQRGRRQRTSPRPRAARASPTGCFRR